jgi:hypothetical protein
MERVSPPPLLTAKHMRVRPQPLAQFAEEAYVSARAILPGDHPDRLAIDENRVRISRPFGATDTLHWTGLDIEPPSM